MGHENVMKVSPDITNTLKGPTHQKVTGKEDFCLQPQKGVNIPMFMLINAFLTLPGFN